MKILIVDDEALARSLLKALLEQVPWVEVVGEAADPVAALALAARLHPDLVFLDIEMPGGNGISVAHELQQRTAAEIVFVTAHEPHAVDAFDLGAADYLLKPVRRPRLALALDRVRSRLRGRQASEVGESNEELADGAFWIRSHRGKVRLPISDIVWIEGARDHVYFHTPSHSWLHRITMAELEDRLRGTGIKRVRRSAFARLDRVAAILRRGKSMLLELDNSTRVTVGPSYQDRILEDLTRMNLRVEIESR